MNLYDDTFSGGIKLPCNIKLIKLKCNAKILRLYQLFTGISVWLELEVFDDTFKHQPTNKTLQQPYYAIFSYHFLLLFILFFTVINLLNQMSQEILTNKERKHTWKATVYRSRQIFHSHWLSNVFNELKKFFFRWRSKGEEPDLLTYV